MSILWELLKRLYDEIYGARNGPRWIKVRNIVRRRDKVCKSCRGKYGEGRQVHHINGWAWFKHLRYTLSNLVLLCDKCHKGFHMWNGGYRKKCTSSDFKKWMRLPLPKRVNPKVKK